MATPVGWRYRGDEQLTSGAYRGDMFTIGDVGYLDEDGFLFIQDRAKDMIISGGVNIFPAEVEAVLVAHEAVADVAVVGVPDDDWGEQVLAVVQLGKIFEPSDDLVDELLKFCAEHLAAYKRPRRIEFPAQICPAPKQASCTSVRSAMSSGRTPLARSESQQMSASSV